MANNGKVLVNRGWLRVSDLPRVSSWAKCDVLIGLKLSGGKDVTVNDGFHRENFRAFLLHRASINS